MFDLACPAHVRRGVAESATAPTIEGRFRGPDGIGNGGYVAGRMAALLGAQPAEVTLRRGWPVDLPLAIARARLVQARGRRGQPHRRGTRGPARPRPAGPPSPDEAAAATRWFLASPFTHSTGLCFVCGSAGPGVGLGVFTGRVEGRPGIAAALWHPDARFAGPMGVSPRNSCGPRSTAPAPSPSRWIPCRSHAAGPHYRPAGCAVAPGEPCIVLGWQIGREGRKLHAGTALFGGDGGLRGIARALWVTPSPVAA